MLSVSRVGAVLLGLSVMTACQDSPTEPAAREPAATIGISIDPDPTLVTFNSASCSVTNSVIGVVTCSWNVSNAAQNSLNLSVEAILIASYQCVNPHSGRIASSEERALATLTQQFGVSGATLSGSNVNLPLTFLPTENRGREKKLNACKGNGVVHNLSYSLDYWDVSVITVSGTLRASCFASDDRFGCLT